MTKVLTFCAMACLIVCLTAARASAQLPIPAIAKAEVNTETLRLTIHGSNFIATPLPRVLLGNDTGRFEELVVIEATPTLIVAGLPAVVPASYRIIVQQGFRGLVIATFDVTFGAAGPQGLQGLQGPPGPPGTPAPDQSGAIAELRDQIGALTGQVNALKDLLQHFSRSGNEIVIKGANLNIVNGLSQTATTNGLGNIILGYNEAGPGTERSGSHNVVLGTQNGYSSYAGIVAGAGNRVSAAFASVLAGMNNSAEADHATVAGGVNVTLTEANGWATRHFRDGADTTRITGKNFDFVATDNAQFQAGMNAFVKVGQLLDMRGGTNVSVRADGNLQLRASGTGELNSGGTLTIRGSIVNIN
jgi:hypothetical protein